MAQKKHRRGGRRVGAGRPAFLPGRVMRIEFQCPKELAARMDAVRGSESRSAFLRRVLELQRLEE